MRYLLAPVLAAAVTLAASAGPQLTAERMFADSVITEIDAARTPADLSAARCSDHPTELARFCDALLLGRRAELTDDAGDARAAEFALERSVSELPRFAPAWYGLGRIRLALAHDTLFSRGGALMGVGVSYLTGAANAFAEAVRRDYTFTPALVALAETPRGRESSSALKERVTVFRKVRGVLPPAVLLDVAAIERDAGSIDSAVALEQRALASGAVDAGVVSLNLARDLYRVGRSDEGRTVLIEGAATPSAQSNAAYRHELAWVASPEELMAWDALTPDRRSAWLADFWQQRDIAGGWKDGARLIEHYRRIEYALKTFPVTLPQTGRQRMLTTTSADLELKAVLDFVKRNTDCFPDAARVAALDEMIGTHAATRAYDPIQNQIDDRGVIWIRHGPPTKRSFSNADEAAEVWRYDSSPTPLVLQFHEVDFDGTTSASTLVPTLITSSQATLDRLCGTEQSLCVPQTGTGRVRDLPPGLGASSPQRVTVPSCGTTFTGREARYAMEANNLPRPLPEQIVHARDSGLKEIRTATTTDRFTRDFTHAVHPGVQIFALRTSNDATAHLLAAYALPVDELHATRSGGQTIYTIAIQLMAANAAGIRYDIDTVRTITVPDARTGSIFITGLVDLPLPPGVYHASLVLTQTDGRGAVASLRAIDLPQPSSAPRVSDLVLGRDPASVYWNSGTTDVALNPLNTWPRGGNAEIYFQLSGLTPGSRYDTRYEIFRAADDSTKRPRLAVSSSATASEPRLEVSRTLGLQNLDPGRYRLRLTVTSGGSATTSVAWLTIVK